MNREKEQEIKHDFAGAGIFVLIFFIFTVSLKWLDVQPIGAGYTDVSWATLNGAMNKLFGTHPFFDKVSDIMLITAIITAAYFAFTGLLQLIKTKSLAKVDTSLYVLAVLYVSMFVCYIFFELITVNYRPILVDGQFEGSYPSSHTLFVCCIMFSAIHRFKNTLKSDKLCIRLNMGCITVIFLTVLSRMLSGMHWFTDIAGAILLSISLFKLYCVLNKLVDYGIIHIPFKSKNK